MGRALGGDLFAASLEDLVINEIQVANIDQFIDPSFNYGGWIELYNPTDTTLFLTRMYISDDPNDPKKFRFPNTMGPIRPGNFRVIWFDHYTNIGDTRYSPNAYKQVPFKLNYEGGTIYLYDSSGKLVAQQSYPPAITRTSYARTSDGASTWSYCSTPTPEASNEGSLFADTQLPPPVVDHEGGVYTTPFNLHVTIPSGATLYYTTNGSTPTPENGKRSTLGRFPIGYKSYIYRFRLFRDGYLPSPVVTRSFIYKDRDYYLPIVSIITDSVNLYDKRIGAYVDGTNGTSGNNKSMSNKNRAWERPVNFEYLVPDSNGVYHSVLNQETDFEVCGGWSRHFFTHSSFRLKAAKQYEGKNYLTYSFFPNDKPYIRHKAIQLRNGGNDWQCRIIDAAIHECVIRSGFYVDAEANQPTHIFINGVHQLMLNAREPSNRNLSYSNYGIDKDSVDQFEINSVKGYEQKAGDDIAFRQWMSLAQKLAANPTNENIYAEICRHVDIDEYCNYMAIECYMGSTDWITNSNNIKGFRDRDDGRFHLVMLDLDSAFGTNTMLGQLSSRLSDSRYDTGHNFLIEIFLNMLKHEGFKRRFIDAFCLVAGSVFEPERCSEIINQMASETEAALAFEGRSPWSSANSLISKISNNENRYSRIAGLRSYFRLKEPYTINLSSATEGATFIINNQEVPTGRFNGPLFAPATIKAIPPIGYRFEGWTADAHTAHETIINADAQWTYYDQGSLDGVTWNNSSFITTGWSSGKAPFGYGTVGIVAGAADYNTTLDFGSDSSQKRPTYYFRKVITLAETPSEKDVFQLTYYVDDGCVIYVNGIEVERYHMPEGKPSYSTYSTSYEGNLAYSSTITIPSNLFHKGQNTIAVEVHNCSGGSSDIFWAASLQRATNKPFSSTSDIMLEQLGEAGTYALTAHFQPLANSEEQLDSLAYPIRINEISAANSIFVGDYFKRNDWIELYNITDMPLDAAGLYISDNFNKPDKYQLTASATTSTIIPAHGYLVVWADKLEPINQLHANFKLSNNNGKMVVLSSSDEFVAANTEFFKLHPSLEDFTDVFVYDTHKGRQSVGRYPDGTNAFYCMDRPTIARPNSLLSYDIFCGYDQGYDYILTGIEDMAFNDETGLTPNDENSDDLNATSPVAVYNLNGQLVATSLSNLRPAIYLVRYQNGRTRKVAVK